VLSEDAPDRFYNRRFDVVAARARGPIATYNASEPDMRTFLAILICTGGLFAVDSLALSSPADARKYSARKYKAKAHPRSYTYRRYSACEERARHEDPTGIYAGYPCWAREALGRGTHGGGLGRGR
jgi:hypothetical protein